MKIYTQKELEAIQLWRLRKLAKETHNIDFKTDTKIKLKSDLISEFLQIQQSKINEMKGKNKSNKEILESLALALLINERSDLIDTIKEYSGEEYENINDLWELSKKTDKELRKIIFDIFKYYINN